MERLLLHACCAPDGAYGVQLLKPLYEIVFYFFNPNIDDKEEYEKREREARFVARYFDVEYIEPDYPVNEWLNYIKGLEGEPEGGARCSRCYEFRMRAASEAARANSCSLFTTVLTISPHKNSKRIMSIGKQLEEETGIRYLAWDFKKKDGFKKSVILSKQLDLYRQNYCGCTFSKRD